MSVAKLTPARRRALDILAGGPARVSNMTSYERGYGGVQPARRTVYWQSAVWLLEQGLVVGVGAEDIEITPAGREALAQ